LDNGVGLDAKKHNSNNKKDTEEAGTAPAIQAQKHARSSYPPGAGIQAALHHSRLRNDNEHNEEAPRYSIQTSVWWYIVGCKRVLYGGFSPT